MHPISISKDVFKIAINIYTYCYYSCNTAYVAIALYLIFDKELVEIYAYIFNFKIFTKTMR